MNTPFSQAATAAPLHLYDFTHGQRRLSLWRESDAHGRVYVIAILAVPVTEQEPGEAPQTRWVDVAHAMAEHPQLIPVIDRDSDVLLALERARFDLYRDEADAVARYLGLPVLDGEATP